MINTPEFWGKLDKKMADSEENWEKLVQGLEIKERKGNIPKKLVERIDLIYCLGNDSGDQCSYSGIDLQHSIEDVGGVVTEIRKIIIPKVSSLVKVIISDGGTISENRDRSEVVRKMIRGDNTLDRLFIFGAVLKSELGGYAATPVFCLDKKPKGKDMGHLNCTSYQGMYPTGNPNGFITINNEWGGRIDIRPDGKGSVYFGNACSPSEAEAVLFDKLVPFDLKKSLILARSPTEAIKFDALHTLEFKEGDREFKYSLIYDNIKSLCEGRTWAVNAVSGFTWENNSYLDLFTRSE